MATLRQASTPKYGIPFTPEDRRQAEIAIAPDIKRVGEQQETLARAKKESYGAEAELATKQSERDIAVKQAGVKATEDYTADIAKEHKTYQDKFSANPLPTHNPTQEDLSSFAQLGSLVMTMGLMVGAGGKGNAKAALDSMTGMMTGWRKGRQDLWQQEARNFEKNFAKVKADRDAIYRNLQEGMKLASTNYTASREKLQTAAFIAGEGSIIAQRIRTGQLGQAVKDLESTFKVENEARSMVTNMAMGLAQQRMQRELAAQANASRERAAKTKAEAKGTTGILKPGAEVTKNYLGQNALASDMQDIAKSLKDPKIAKMITDNRLEAFASEEFGKIISQLITTEIPAELREFLTKVRSVRNNYYLTISGKAVTGGEAMRNYGVVPQPGDAPEAMTTKTNAMIQQLDRSIAQYQILYGLPKISDEAIKALRDKDSGFDVRALPIENEASPVKEGDKFTSKSGKPIIYRNGNWEYE